MESMISQLFRHNIVDLFDNLDELLDDIDGIVDADDMEYIEDYEEAAFSDECDIEEDDFYC